MTKKEYIEKLSEMKIDAAKVDKLEKLYGATFPESVRKIISNNDDTVFFDDDYRILSLSEIEAAEKELHVEFRAKNILPLIDCGENDFIVYHYNDDIWSKFNIIDEVVFKKKDAIEELLK